MTSEQLKKFKEGFLKTCSQFMFHMGDSAPSWFIDYLKETRVTIEPNSSRVSVKVTEWKGHSFEEIEAHLHALHLSSAGLAFNCMLSKETGYWMAHQCGCDDCFYPASPPDITFPSWAFMGKDYAEHVLQQKQQLGIAA